MIPDALGDRERSELILAAASRRDDFFCNLPVMWVDKTDLRSAQSQPFASCIQSDSRRNNHRAWQGSSTKDIGGQATFSNQLRRSGPLHQSGVPNLSAGCEPFVWSRCSVAAALAHPARSPNAGRSTSVPSPALPSGLHPLFAGCPRYVDRSPTGPRSMAAMRKRPTR